MIFLHTVLLLWYWYLFPLFDLMFNNMTTIIVILSTITLLECFNRYDCHHMYYRCHMSQIYKKCYLHRFLTKRQQCFSWYWGLITNIYVFDPVFHWFMACLILCQAIRPIAVLWSVVKPETKPGQTLNQNTSRLFKIMLKLSVATNVHHFLRP